MLIWTDARNLVHRFSFAIALLLPFQVHEFVTAAACSADEGFNASSFAPSVPKDFPNARLPVVLRRFRGAEVPISTSQLGLRVAADELLVEADQLRSQWNAESWRAAIQKYKTALVNQRAVKARQEEIKTLRLIGELHSALSAPKLALPYFHQALAILRHFEPRRTEEVEIMNDLANAHLLLGENKKALEYCRAGLQLSRSINYSRGEAQALELLGQVQYASGNLTQSLKLYDQALPIWRNLNDPTGQAQTLLDSGYTYSDLSETDNAFKLYNEALPLWRAISNPRGEALTLTAMGHLYSKLGQKQQALNLYLQSIELLQPIEDQIALAFNHDGLAYVLSELGEQTKALEQYEQALSLFRKVEYRYGEVGALGKIGGIYLLQGDYSKALEYLRQSLALGQTIGDPRMQSIPVALIGRVHEQLGNRRAALESYTRALTLNRLGKDRRQEAYTLTNVGRVHETADEIQPALEYYKRALSLNSETGDRFGESLTLHNIARVEHQMGKVDSARRHSEQSISIVETLRTQVASQDLRSSYVASVHEYYELTVDIMMALHKRDPGKGYDEIALEVGERARARSLLETLAETHANIRQGVDPVLLERERELQQQLNSKAERQLRLLRDGHEEEEAEVLGQEIRKLTSEHRTVEGQIRATSPRYAALTQPQPLTMKEIKQQILDGKSMLLEYALGNKRSYLWAITRTEVLSYELPGRSEIETAARGVYDLLIANQPMPGETFQQRQTRVAKANEQLPSQVAHLSRLILAPVAPKLGTQRLLIVPDGALQYIPFQILTKPAGGSENSAGSEINAKAAEPRTLLADHEIVNEPSASALALLLSDMATRKPASSSVAVLADPVFDLDDPRITASASPTATISPSRSQKTELQRAVRDVVPSAVGGRIPRLWASGDEADAIMAAVPWGSGFKATGFEASRATVMRPELSEYAAVHFATHGFLNDQHPELSGVVLSLYDQKGQPQDGFLRLHDIYNLKLPVDLVVLSACSTALGKDVQGEGLIGLTRGFMYAGAGSVVASLWKVDDEATAELMRHFYGFMLKDGLSPAAALRQAQLKMSQQKRWQSPYYWSGFIIQGQYTQNARPGKFNVRWVALVGSLAAVLGIAAFFALRRRRRSVL
ncbi:MAG: CHAT domain-containing protein [Pyrinomonadaceae bacterium]|nr:CHAT domain-containing protein [Pyrinomonadaceae bacterium]